MMSEPLGEVGANISLQLSSEHSLLKSIIKKLSPKINVKNTKTRVFFSTYVDFSQIGKADWSMLERLLLPHV